MKSILAIDPGTRCGWAYWRQGWRRPESGVMTFELARGESQGMRFVRFRRWLEELAAWKPDIWLYEQAHHRGGYATEIAVGMTTRIQEAAILAGAEYKAVHSATLKKWAAGNGRADKQAMIRAAQRFWCIEPQDDNEADALCLLAYGACVHAGIDLRQDVQTVCARPGAG